MKSFHEDGCPNRFSRPDDLVLGCTCWAADPKLTEQKDAPIPDTNPRAHAQALIPIPQLELLLSLPPDPVIGILSVVSIVDTLTKAENIPLTGSALKAIRNLAAAEMYRQSGPPIPSDPLTSDGEFVVTDKDGKTKSFPLGNIIVRIGGNPPEEMTPDEYQDLLNRIRSERPTIVQMTSPLGSGSPGIIGELEELGHHLSWLFKEQELERRANLANSVIENGIDTIRTACDRIRELEREGRYHFKQCGTVTHIELSIASNEIRCGTHKIPPLTWYVGYMVDDADDMVPERCVLGLVTLGEKR